MSKAPLASWRKIRRDLLRMLQSGIWKPGDQIPNEVELAEAYHCTRSTVSRALRDLADAGFLVRKRKGGTRVAHNPTRKAPLEIPIFGEAIERTGCRYDFKLVTAEPKTAPAYATQALGMPQDSMLFHVQVVHFGDGIALQFEDRWLNSSAAPGIANVDLARIPIDKWLLEFAPLSRARINIMAVQAEEFIANHLQAHRGEALLLVERTSFRLARPLSFLRLFHRPGYRIETGI